MLKTTISTVANNLTIDLVKLRYFITHEWQSNKLYQDYVELGLKGKDIYISILIEIGDYADMLMDEVRESARKKFNAPHAQLEWFRKYPQTDVRSIGFALVNFLSAHSLSPIEELTYEDIPAILEFIDTPPDKALEGWAQWEHYWSTIDLPARRKKLLEEINNPEQAQ